MPGAFRCWSTAARARCISRSTCRTLGVDFYVFTGHKLYGPTGIGVLYGKYDLLAAMQPYQGGGEMIDVVTRDAITYNEPPHRFEAGTPPIVQAIGLGAAIDYVEALGRDAIAAHEAEIAAYAARKAEPDQFAAADRRCAGQGRDLRVRARRAPTPTTSRPSSTATASPCAPAPIAPCRCSSDLACTSTCRASLGLYNGKDDIDALVEGIEKARTFFA